MFRPPARVQVLMRGFAPDWFIAGGWALDLFLGRETRAHRDIEIAIFRQDQLALQDHLRDWNLQIAADGQLTAWKRGEFLEPPLHAIHCFSARRELPFLEVLFNESANGVWQFRRRPAITKPLAELFLTNDSGIRFLCPEVVLLYKSKNPRAADEQDFSAAVGSLRAESKNWLRAALAVCHPNHPWLSRL